MTQKALTLISDNHAMVVACLCMLGGQVCIWFGSNAQCVWKWWSDKPLLTVILFGVQRHYSFGMALNMLFLQWMNFGVRDSSDLACRM